MRWPVAAGALLAVGCATVPVANAPITGQWGGRHIGLLLTQGGGTIEYDCAAGTIDGPLVPARDGSFSATGTHTPGTGGPDRVGEVRPAFPVRYSGRVRGDRLQLHGRLDNGVVLGPFDLRRGAEPGIFRCL